MKKSELLISRARSGLARPGTAREEVPQRRHESSQILMKPYEFLIFAGKITYAPLMGKKHCKTLWILDNLRAKRADKMT